MKQLIGSTFIVVLAAASSFACTSTVGETTDSSQDKIVGGSEATPGEWAGTVALYRGSQQVCAGTLVADEWVISAGHCVISPSQPNGGISKIVVNRHNLTVSTTGEDIPVKKAIRHPSYNSSTLDNDISLFQLERPSSAPKATIIRPDQAPSATTAEAMTTVVGWGATREGGRPSNVLLEVDVPIITNAQCKTYPRYNNVTDNMICAGYVNGQKDSCQGDSGGPLFMKIDDKITHIGIVSWGIGCARANAPGVYTSVGRYHEWLKTTSGGAVVAAEPPPPEPPPTSVLPE
jgi:secreted trypsin-like serine protease